MQNPKRARISESGNSDNEDHIEKAKLYGNVNIEEYGHELRRTVDAPVQGTWWRVRQRARGENSYKRDTEKERIGHEESNSKPFR